MIVIAMPEYKLIEGCYYIMPVTIVDKCTVIIHKSDGTQTSAVFQINRPISRVVIGREFDYRSRLIYVWYCLTNTTLCL